MSPGRDRSVVHEAEPRLPIGRLPETPKSARFLVEVAQVRDLHVLVRDAVGVAVEERRRR
jgi:hypothetical protein